LKRKVADKDLLEKDFLRKDFPDKNFPQKTLRVLFVLLFFAFAFLLQAQKQGDQAPAQAPKAESPKAEYKVPPEDAAKPNPIKPTAESLAKGKKMYGYDCAMCHGDKGDGKGDMASDYKNVTDFTNPDSLKGRTDGELFYIIRNGKGESMPGEGDRAKDDQVWDMVNYIRSLAKK
jgi:mono/diheme cytochrome c family protein